MPVVVVATIRPLPEHRQAVIDAFREAIPAVHAEPGCALYALTTAEDRLVMVEQWDSPEALAAHAGGDALKVLNAANTGRFSEPPEVLVLQPVPAGDPAKGQVRA
jgi:quinol monooxygenase YgiN